MTEYYELFTKDHKDTGKLLVTSKLNQKPKHDIKKTPRPEVSCLLI